MKEEEAKENEEKVSIKQLSSSSESSDSAEEAEEVKDDKVLKQSSQIQSVIQIADTIFTADKKNEQDIAELQIQDHDQMEEEVKDKSQKIQQISNIEGNSDLGMLKQIFANKGANGNNKPFGTSMFKSMRGFKSPQQFWEDMKLEKGRKPEINQIEEISEKPKQERKLDLHLKVNGPEKEKKTILNGIQKLKNQLISKERVQGFQKGKVLNEEIMSKIENTKGQLENKGINESETHFNEEKTSEQRNILNIEQDNSGKVPKTDKQSIKQGLQIQNEKMGIDDGEAEKKDNFGVFKSKIEGTSKAVDKVESQQSSASQKSESDEEDEEEEIKVREELSSGAVSNNSSEDEDGVECGDELNDSLLTDYDVGGIDVNTTQKQKYSLLSSKTGDDDQKSLVEALQPKNSHRHKRENFYIGSGTFEKIKRLYIRSIESTHTQPFFSQKCYKFEWITGEVEKKNFFFQQLQHRIPQNESMNHQAPHRSFLIKKKHYIKDKSNLQQFGVATCSRKGDKDDDLPNQDDYLFYKDELSSVFAVFDGHGPFGHIISNLAYRILFMKFLSSLNSYLAPETALRSIFRTISNDIDQFIKRLNLKCNQYVSGVSCTFIVHRFNKLVVCHLGDTKAFIFKKSLNLGKKDKVLATQLCDDHIPSNPEERMRVYQQFGEVKRCQDFQERVFVRGRNYPGLHITRSIGDLIAKEIGVIGEPQIKAWPLDQDDHFLIVGTASFFELLPLEEIWSLLLPFSATSVTDASRVLQTRIKYLQMQHQSHQAQDFTFILAFL